MTLKINMRPVRLAKSGRRLFDAPYCYQDEIKIGDAVLTSGTDCYYASRDLTEEERGALVEAIKAANDEQEREWGVNQPLGQAVPNEK